MNVPGCAMDIQSSCIVQQIIKDIGSFLSLVPLIVSHDSYVHDFLSNFVTGQDLCEKQQIYQNFFILDYHTQANCIGQKDEMAMKEQLIILEKQVISF